VRCRAIRRWSPAFARHDLSRLTSRR
jgi:hypothetical protein